MPNLTIKDIARISGCSVSTISRVINDRPDVRPETKEHVLTVMREAGFVPNTNARQLKIQQSRSLVFVVKGTRNIFFSDFLVQLQRAATLYGYNGIVSYLDENANEIDAAEKGGYEHFMFKEIMEQPRAIKSTLDPRVKDHRVVFDELKMTDAQLMGFNKIMITACGSAFYAGQAGKYALEKLTHIPVDADLASEFRYRDPIVDEHTLMIIISQSGETADTIAAIREAQSKGAYVLSIVNVVGSTIARISDDVIYTWAGPEIAVATTKGYTTQVSVLYLLALYLGEKRGCLSREEAAKLTDDLMILPQMVQRAIDLNPQIAQLAERYKNNPSLFFIGRNVDYAVCMEGYLKLKEISYLHSEAYAAGELKHGTIALIE